MLNHFPYNVIRYPVLCTGVAAVPGAFTEKIIKDMAVFNKHPVIFALSNPTHKAECTAQDAYAFSDVSIYYKYCNT